MKQRKVYAVEKFLPMVKRSECCKIMLDDIMYFEKVGRMVRIATCESSYYEYGKISDYAQYFEDDSRFYVCMKGLVVNFDHVNSMKDQTIYFSNGRQYEFGRTNYLKAKQAFVSYLMKASDKSRT